MRKQTSSWLSGVELRVQPNADGTRTVTGLVPYDKPSTGLPWEERIQRGAFSDALKGSEVLLLRDHLQDKLLANTAAGTMTLTDTAAGLAFTASLPNSPTGQDTAESLERGDLRGVSFGFQVKPQGDSWGKDKTGMLTRSLNDVTLQEISITSWAVFADATVSLRSVPAEFRKSLKHEHRSNANGCPCPCDACQDDDCENCDNPECRWDDCEGCPEQGDEEDRSLRLQIEIARRL